MDGQRGFPFTGSIFRPPQWPGSSVASMSSRSLSFQHTAESFGQYFGLSYVSMARLTLGIDENFSRRLVGQEWFDQRVCHGKILWCIYYINFLQSFWIMIFEQCHQTCYDVHSWPLSGHSGIRIVSNGVTECRTELTWFPGESFHLKVFHV